MLGPRANDIIQQKKVALSNSIDALEITSDIPDRLNILEILPLASGNADPSIPCSSPDMTKEFRHLLRDIDYDKEEYLAAKRIAESDEFEKAERSATPTELGFAIEKEPTAYILRRQFCTDLHIVGCTQDEIEYAMGHKIENTAIDRRDFRNEDRITALAEKIIKRPFVSKEVLNQKEIVMSETSYKNSDFYNETIRVPIRKGKLRIRISSHEPLDKASITIILPENLNSKCCYYQLQRSAPQRREVNVLNDYYDSYRKAYEELECREKAKK